jgi:hypothetical protein
VRRGAAPTGQNDRMSRQQRGGGTGEVARGAGYAALLGALLIGVAVVIGIVLLQIGDRNDNGPVSAPKSSTTTTTTTTTKPVSSTKTTPNTAHRAGYTSISPANDWTGHGQVGDSVYCRGGLDREGARLATLVGPNIPFHPAFPAPAPTDASGKDCFVVVGSKT